MNPRFLLAVTLSLTCSQQPDQAKKKDFDAMQGDWKVNWIERDGQKYELDRELVVTIKGNKRLHEKRELLELEIDPSCDPKIIDMTVLLEGTNKGTKVEGIYKIEGDKMQWCWYNGEGTKQRPLEFHAKSGSDRIWYDMSRVKR